MKIKMIEFQTQDFGSFKIKCEHTGKDVDFNGSYTSKAPALDGLAIAAKGCKKAVCTVFKWLEPLLETGLIDEYRLSKVHFHNTEKLYGAVFTILVVDDAEGFTTNTRLAYFNPESETPGAGLNANDGQALFDLYTEAENYIAGKRKQMDIFEAAGAATKIENEDAQDEDLAPNQAKKTKKTKRAKQPAQ